MATIAKALKLIDVANLNGQNRPVAYVPKEIVEKQVPLVIKVDDFGNKVHEYTFSKASKKYTSNLSVSDNMSDGDSITVVLGIVEKPFPWKTDSGKSGIIAVGKQKLLAKPVDFKLPKAS